jgi:thiol-disulfide isomerase/thioredoxin
MKRLSAVIVAATLLAACAPGSQVADGAGTPKATPKTLVGQPFPNVPFSAWGTTNSVASFDVVQSRVVNLWATWCAVCREEFDVLVRSEYANVVVAVNVSDAATSSAALSAGQPLVDSVGAAFPIYIDNTDVVMRDLGLRGLPVTLAVNRAGRIVDVEIGTLTATSLARLVAAATGP